MTATTERRHLQAVSWDPEPIPDTHAALAAAKVQLLEAAEKLRAAQSALGAVSILDPAYGCAASTATQVDEVRLQVASAVEHLDNRGVA